VPEAVRSWPGEQRPEEPRLEPEAARSRDEPEHRPDAGARRNAEPGWPMERSAEALRAGASLVRPLGRPEQAARPKEAFRRHQEPSLSPAAAHPDSVGGAVQVRLGLHRDGLDVAGRARGPGAVPGPASGAQAVESARRQEEELASPPRGKPASGVGAGLPGRRLALHRRGEDRGPRAVGHPGPGLSVVPACPVDPDDPACRCAGPGARPHPVAAGGRGGCPEAPLRGKPGWLVRERRARRGSVGLRTLAARAATTAMQCRREATR
jgi:hypothetical protein